MFPLPLAQSFFFPFSNIIFICIRVTRLFYRFKNSMWLPPHQAVWLHPSFHLYVIRGSGYGCSLAARVLAYMHKALGLSPNSPSASVVACLYSSVWEVWGWGEEESGVHGYPWLHSEFEFILSYSRTLKKRIIWHLSM